MYFKRRMINYAVLFLFLLAGPAHAAMLLDKVVAVVNKDVITWSELYRAMEFEASSAMKALSDAEKSRAFRENEARFLEGMIDVKLQLQAAKKLDIEAGREDIAEAVESVKKKYSMSDTEFEESLRKEGFTLNDYKKRIAEQITLSKAVAQEVRNKIVISDSAVNAYLAVNKDAGYRIRQIFFGQPENDTEKKALEEKIKEVFQRIKNGDDFARLAMQYSEDLSGKAGGDLGFIKKEHLSREFLEVAAPMKAGEVSRLFSTAKGFHIIKLEERFDAGDEMKEAARKKLFEKRFNEDLRSWIRGLRERSYVEVKL